MGNALLCRNALTLGQVPREAITAHLLCKVGEGGCPGKTSVGKDWSEEREREQGGKGIMRKAQQRPVALYLIKSQFSLINK